MPTQLSVWNEAVGLLGRTPRTTVDGTDDLSLMLADLWTRVPAAIFEEADWNCAILREKLQRLDETPTMGYDYLYQLPRYLVRIVNVNDSGVEHDDFERWEQEGRKIASSAETLYCWFVSKTVVATPGTWTQNLADYIGAEMAVRAAPKHAKDYLADCKETRDKRRKLAMALDARMGPPRRLRPGRWVAARLAGGGVNAEQE